MSCRVSGGTGTVSPGLTVAGSPGGIKINFQGSLAKGNCTSAVTQPQGDQVTGGTFTGSGYYTGATASSCANFHGVDVVGQITVTVTWVTTGTPIAPTTIVYKNNPRDRLRDTREHDHLTGAPPGTAMKSGSFSAGTPRLTRLMTDLPTPANPACPTTVPDTTFTITDGHIKV